MFVVFLWFWHNNFLRDKVLSYLIFRFLPESARWLISQGRKEEALKELQRAARLNGTTVPEDLLDKVSCVNNAINYKPTEEDWAT